MKVQLGFIFFILLSGLSGAVFPQELYHKESCPTGPEVTPAFKVETGTYHNNAKNDDIILTLNEDHSFIQKWKSCTFQIDASGNWELSRDTVILNFTQNDHEKCGSECNMAKKRNNRFVIRDEGLQMLFLNTGSYKTCYFFVKDEKN